MTTYCVISTVLIQTDLTLARMSVSLSVVKTHVRFMLYLIVGSKAEILKHNPRSNRPPIWEGMKVSNTTGAELNDTVTSTRNRALGMTDVSDEWLTQWILILIAVGVLVAICCFDVFMYACKSNKTKKNKTSDTKRSQSFEPSKAKYAQDHQKEADQFMDVELGARLQALRNPGLSNSIDSRVQAHGFALPNLLMGHEGISVALPVTPPGPPPLAPGYNHKDVVHINADRSAADTTDDSPESKVVDVLDDDHTDADRKQSYEEDSSLSRTAQLMKPVGKALTIEQRTRYGASMSKRKRKLRSTADITDNSPESEGVDVHDDARIDVDHNTADIAVNPPGSEVVEVIDGARIDAARTLPSVIAKSSDLQKKQSPNSTKIKSNTSAKANAKRNGKGILKNAKVGVDKDCPRLMAV